MKRMNLFNMDSDARIAKAFALSLGAAVALGLARFNYALVLPAMRQSLEWTFAQAGSMNTTNALGYLTGALVAAPLAASVGLVRCFWLALLLTGCALVGTGLTDNFTLLSIMRFSTGLTGAATFISGATLASHLASGGQSGLVLGIYFGGVGIGIFLAGLGVPQLLERNGEMWRAVWIVMGVLACITVPIAREAATTMVLPTKRDERADLQRFPSHLLPAMLAYFLFGLGYITYMTFVIAFLRSSGVAAAALSGFWLLLGLSTFASAFIWRAALDKLRGGQSLAATLLVVAVGAGLPLVSTSLVGVLLSALLFGGAFLSVVASVTNIVRRALPSAAWAWGIALFTIFFSVGQAFGPLISGLMADRTNSLTGGFLLSVLFLAMGAILALLQKPHDA